jgi:RNA polymerase sigma-70 factor (ECF subfamily)
MSDDEKGEEYSRLVATYSSAVLRYSLRRLNDWAGCEDVVAETFLIAWRRWDTVPGPERELAWLYSIAFRVLSNHRRARYRRHRLHDRLSLEREDIDDVSEVNVAPLKRALSSLRDGDRELLELVYWEKLSYRDIALVLGISENAVGIRINRAKRNLKSILQPLQFENQDLTSFGRELES